jgi:pimeloyl-ACP methyl ester carboxylesterase
MFTHRFIPLSIVAILLVTACAPQSLSTTQASEPTVTVPPAVQPASATVPAVEPTIASTSTSPKDEFEVNGHSLYIKCLGTGSPTIVIETGEGGNVSEVSQIQKTLATRTTTCAYDRANNGRSDSAPTPRTAKDIAEDLHALLRAAEVAGPYLLAGHSAGGMIVQLYAHTYPDEVIGVVAMNPVPPAHPWLDEVSKISTAEEYADEEAYYRGANGESLDYLTSSEQLMAASMPPDVPFEMLISTSVQCEGDKGCLKSYPVYEQIIQDVTASWPRGNLMQIATLHNIFDSDPDAVVAAVDRILASS